MHHKKHYCVTSLDTDAICPSSIQVSVTTSVNEPPAKYSITTWEENKLDMSIIKFQLAPAILSQHTCMFSAKYFLVAQSQ